MTGEFSRPGALFLPAAGAVGCFNSPTMQPMQDANQTYSRSPSFMLDRNRRTAILPPRDGDTELPARYDRAGLLLMKPGWLTLVARAEFARILHGQRCGVTGVSTRIPLRSSADRWAPRRS